MIYELTSFRLGNLVLFLFNIIPMLIIQVLLRIKFGYRSALKIIKVQRRFVHHDQIWASV